MGENMGQYDYKKDNSNYEYLSNILFSNFYHDHKNEKRDFFSNHRYLFSLMTKKEIASIKLFYGIDCDEIYLKDIGESLNCSRETIRQYIRNAINKIAPIFSMAAALTDEDIKKMGFDIESMTKEDCLSGYEKFKRQQAKIENFRFRHLSRENQIAELSLDIALNKNISTLEILEIDKKNLPHDIKTIKDLLGLKKRQINNPKYKNIVNAVHSKGLLFFREEKNMVAWKSHTLDEIKEYGIEKFKKEMGIGNFHEIATLLYSNISVLDLPRRFMDKFNKTHINTIEDLLKTTSAQRKLIKGYVSDFEDILEEKMNEFGLNLCDQIDDTEWIDLLKANFERCSFVSKLAQIIPNKTIDEDKFDLFLNRDIKELNFSLRAYNALKRNGINTVKDIVVNTIEELSILHYIGAGSVTEIVSKLQKLGLHLRSEEYTQKEWIEFIKTNYFEAHKNNVEDKKELDNINITYNEYKQQYATNAGIKACEEIKNNTLDTLIHRATKKNEYHKHLVLEREKEDNCIYSNDILDFVKENLMCIYNLDAEFVIKNRLELLDIIKKSNLSEDKQSDLILYIANQTNYAEM